MTAAHCAGGRPTQNSAEPVGAYPLRRDGRLHRCLVRAKPLQFQTRAVLPLSDFHRSLVLSQVATKSFLSFSLPLAQSIALLLISFQSCQLGAMQILGDLPKLCFNLVAMAASRRSGLFIW